MAPLDDLYKEVLLDHYQHPRNRGRLSDPQVANRGYNPLCGDELELFANFEGDRIQALMFEGRGCSISQASASMMTESLIGRSLADAEKIVAAFKDFMLSRGDGAALAELGASEDLESLQGVKQYPVRIKCALLPWNTFSETVQLYRARRAEGSPG